MINTYSAELDNRSLISKLHGLSLVELLVALTLSILVVSLTAHLFEALILTSTQFNKHNDNWKFVLNGDIAQATPVVGKELRASLLNPSNIEDGSNALVFKSQCNLIDKGFCTCTVQYSLETIDNQGKCLVREVTYNSYIIQHSVLISNIESFNISLFQDRLYNNPQDYINPISELAFSKGYGIDIRLKQHDDQEQEIVFWIRN